MNFWKANAAVTTMSDDRCVCCGSYVPEGRQVCSTCSGDKKQEISAEEADMIRWLSNASDKDIIKAMRQTEKMLFGSVLA